MLPSSRRALGEQNLRCQGCQWLTQHVGLGLFTIVPQPTHSIRIGRFILAVIDAFRSAHVWTSR